MSESSFDQFALFCKMSERNKREDHSNLEIRNILDGYDVSEYNRNIEMSAEEKSQRLYHMIDQQPVQNMIGRPTHYRLSARILQRQLGYIPPKVVLFDGCHRLRVIKDFMDGECYVKMYCEEDECYHYLWATQKAVDAVTENREYHHKIEDELLQRLLTCRISMTLLDRECTDQYAYERARIANKCKPLTHAQIMKYMSCYDTFVGNLLKSIHVEDSLSAFLGDDIYRYYFSLIRMFIQFGFQANFLHHAVMLQGTRAVEKAEELIKSKELPMDDMFASKVRHAILSARAYLNDLLDNVIDHDPKLVKLSNKRNSDTSAVGLFFFALGLASANADNASDEEEKARISNHISIDSIKQMLIKYLGMNSSEKGENHRRLYAFFVSGHFPDLTIKNKKRKLADSQIEPVETMTDVE